VPQSTTTANTLKFTHKAQNNINLQQFFFLIPNGSLVLENITITVIDNSDVINVTMNNINNQKQVVVTTRYSFSLSTYFFNSFIFFIFD
jgi:hypothetical protein